MPPVPPRQWPRGPWNELHEAAKHGSTERTVALLSNGSIDIDQGNPWGATALIIAAGRGYPTVIRVLLNKGANPSIVADDGFTALTALNMGAPHNKHVVITKMLVKAGADMDAATRQGFTALYLAAQRGHSEAMTVLIEEGANVDVRAKDNAFRGETPLHGAACGGHLNCARLLLKAKANPLLTKCGSCVPLDDAVQNGHSEMVRLLTDQLGIEGCGGASGGLQALRLAAQLQRVDILAILADAGVVDTTGRALHSSASGGRESSVKFFLQQFDERKTTGIVGYVEIRDPFGMPPLFYAIRGCSPRIVRLLVDAGADTTSAVRFTNARGG